MPTCSRCGATDDRHSMKCLQTMALGWAMGVEERPELTAIAETLSEDTISRHVSELATMREELVRLVAENADLRRRLDAQANGRGWPAVVQELRGTIAERDATIEELRSRPVGADERQLLDWLEFPTSDPWPPLVTHLPPNYYDEKHVSAERLAEIQREVDELNASPHLDVVVHDDVNVTATPKQEAIPAPERPAEPLAAPEAPPVPETAPAPVKAGQSVSLDVRREWAERFFTERIERTGGSVLPGAELNAAYNAWAAEQGGPAAGLRGPTALSVFVPKGVRKGRLGGVEGWLGLRLKSKDASEGSPSRSGSSWPRFATSRSRRSPSRVSTSSRTAPTSWRSSWRSSSTSASAASTACPGRRPRPPSPTCTRPAATSGSGRRRSPPAARCPTPTSTPPPTSCS
jgi:hypothetical protein